MRLLSFAVALLFWSAGAVAQGNPQYELRGFFQQDRAFSLWSGSPDFDIQGARSKGGGFGFALTPAEWFALWTEVSFFSGVRQGDYTLSFLVETQGLRYSTAWRGPFRVYGRGGVGFARFAFEGPGFAAAYYKMSLVYGGGAEVRLSDPVSFFVDASALTMGLPELTAVPGRDKWDTSILLGFGIAVKF